MSNAPISAPTAATTPAEPRRGVSGARWWAALAGIVGAGVGLAVAELVSVLVSPRSSPIAAAGAAVVDVTPAWLKDWAIATFGTADKVALFVTMGIVMLIGAGLAGLLERRREPWGAGLVLLVAVAGASVAMARPDATIFWALPSVVGGVTGAAVLRSAIRRLDDWERISDPDPEIETPLSAARRRAELDRRRFLTYTGVAGVSAVLVAAGSRAISTTSRVVEQARTTLRLPFPAIPADPVPPGAELSIDGLDSYVTANDNYYRIDTALRIPQVDPDTWTLRVVGMVDEPFEITMAELLALPLEEHYTTLACVSNDVGGSLIGNALWLGYPLRELLARAKPQAGADMVLSRSADGWTASTPLGVLQDENRASLLAVGMNGEPLPLDHGFPARLVVPGLYGYVSATKWVTELKVTTFADDVGYWTTRGWTAKGPIKMSSRIDTPSRNEKLTAGSIPVAGMAWAQHTGIDTVEVRVDDGLWELAELGETVSADTWQQWVYRWDATPGDHTLTVRATDVDGMTQTDQYAPPAPDGSTGWHVVEVKVN